MRSVPAFSWILHFFPQTNHPPLSKVERVSPYVWRILGCNPGYHTLQGTNIYLIVSPDSKDAFILDSGEGWSSPLFIHLLMEVIECAEVSSIRAILLSHGHLDHQGGVPSILAAVGKKFPLKPLPTVYKRKLVNGNYPEQGFSCEDIRHCQVFALDSNIYLQAVHTPGHTDDHVVFLFPLDRSLFAGDCILGCGTSVFDDLDSYMQSLQMLRTFVVQENLENIYPGHGPTLNHVAVQKIDEYLFHRAEREAQILTALRQVGGSCTSIQLVFIVYGRLPIGVVLSAQGNVLHHLTKLQRNGKVRVTFPDLWEAIET